MNEHIIPRI